ncbi:lipopolysaccharide biosynthesis protein [Rubinisphaera margarita]|uniref:lipopolysaccharide biosynthesis protein n=1 Tax=Rubinisphaera margarita TaxID=2909586 RepID=UPI001EE7AF9E|nr:lipopolysaccharide biosynthesis protein [Rubinisphaera margarita]MCG6155270.1 lipopolysaccharide biosynthesis protein [Rubinisphaera margarita]
MCPVATPPAPRARSTSITSKLILTNGSLSLIDQIVVSGSRFATTIAIGRFCGVEELANYSLLMSLFLLALGIQQSLVMGPFSIFSNRSSENADPDYPRTVLALFWLLALSMSLVVTGGAGIAALVGPAQLNGTMLALLAICLPALLARELVRQLGFAALNLRDAVITDTIVACVQLTGILLLVLNGMLDAYTAVIATSLGTAIASGLYFYRRRSRLTPRTSMLAAVARRHWNFGRWNLGSQVAELLTWHSLSWILLFQVGLEGTGIFAACMTIVALLNPVLLAANNLMAPHAARAFDQGGIASLRRMIFQATCGLGALVGVFCCVIAIFGQDLLELIYGSPSYASGVGALIIASFALLAEVIGDTANHALRALDHPHVNLRSSCLGLVVMLILAVPLIHSLQITGAALALLAGSSATSWARWHALLAISADPSEEETL